VFAQQPVLLVLVAGGAVELPDVFLDARVGVLGILDDDSSVQDGKRFSAGCLESDRGEAAKGPEFALFASDYEKCLSALAADDAEIREGAVKISRLLFGLQML
jgi:hypothetical protein